MSGKSCDQKQSWFGTGLGFFQGHNLHNQHTLCCIYMTCIPITQGNWNRCHQGDLVVLGMCASGFVSSFHLSPELSKDTAMLQTLHESLLQVVDRPIPSLQPLSFVQLAEKFCATARGSIIMHVYVYGTNVLSGFYRICFVRREQQGQSSCVVPRPISPCVSPIFLLEVFPNHWLWW